MEDKRGVRKTRVGVVVSDKMDKTVVVEVGLRRDMSARRVVRILRYPICRIRE